MTTTSTDQSAEYGTENRDGIPYVVTTRSSKAAAERYIAGYADALGDTDYWNGQRAVPIRIVWVPVRHPFTKKWQVVATVTPREVTS